VYIQNVFNVFKNFDYIIIKDMTCLLQKGYIENKFLNIDMERKDNINNNQEHFIWKLLIDSGYLIIDPNNKMLKIRNNAMKIFIEKKFSEWKNILYSEYEDIINSFIIDFDEEKIIKFLEDSMKSIKNKKLLLNKYYNLILVLLSLNEKNVVITKNNYNERHDIRELLVVDKNYINIFKNSNSISNIKKDNKNNSNTNDNYDKNNKLERSDCSYIIYITIKGINNQNMLENGCIQALDDNEDFKFDGKELKNLYDKIIKFGIAFCNKHCDVIYELNYGDNFKRKEMPKRIYSNEQFKEFNMNDYYFIDKTRMISKLIDEKSASYLITRPRRFGKSLNLKMVKEFFEKSNKMNTKREFLFDGLEVTKDRRNMREF